MSTTVPPFQEHGLITINHSITVANITVPKQQFALVNVASFSGDTISSGILGLGLRGLTAAFTGSNPSEDGIGNLVNYAPLMETIGTSKAASPILSFAMSREENRSYIAFGGVPPVSTGEYTTVPIQKVPTCPEKASRTPTLCCIFLLCGANI